MSYKDFLQKVEDIVAEPLPEQPSESLASQRESWINTKFNMRNKIDGLYLDGWPLFNRATLGLRPHEFTILCGPTGSGKTTVLKNITAKLGLQNIPYFSGAVETGMDDDTRVLAGILANENPYRSFSEAEIQRIDTEFGQILNSKQHVTCRYDSRVPHKRLLADLLYAHETFGTRVAMIDNLNFLMDVKASKDQLIAMDQAVHDFVVFVKKVPIHVFMVMHPRKDTSGRVDSEFDIKGSSTSVQEASNVILWNRLKEDADASHGTPPQYCREMKFAKIRKNGRAVGFRIVYSIDRESPKFTEEKFL